jgi:hypothetical protein
LINRMKGAVRGWEDSRLNLQEPESHIEGFVLKWRDAIMADDLEEKIAIRAYYIWLEEGKALGRDKEHWVQARRDLGLGDEVELPPLQPEPTTSHGESAGPVDGQPSREEKVDASKLDMGAVG